MLNQIDLIVNCDKCNRTLDIEVGYGEKNDFTIHAEPCPDCIEVAVNEAIQDIKCLS